MPLSHPSITDSHPNLPLGNHPSNLTATPHHTNPPCHIKHSNMLYWTMFVCLRALNICQRHTSVYMNTYWLPCYQDTNIRHIVAQQIIIVGTWK